jgi:branched-chain amino acid transport system ATP-binding protein
MVEQNVKSALLYADQAIALESGRMVMQRPAGDILSDPNLQNLFLGGSTATEPAPAPPPGLQSTHNSATEV